MVKENVNSNGTRTTNVYNTTSLNGWFIHCRDRQNATLFCPIWSGNFMFYWTKLTKVCYFRSLKTKQRKTVYHSHSNCTISRDGCLLQYCLSYFQYPSSHGSRYSYCLLKFMYTCFSYEIYSEISASKSDILKTKGKIKKYERKL